MTKVLSSTLTDKDFTEVVSVITTQLNGINKPSFNTEPRSETKFLKSKHRIRHLQGCDYGATIEKVVVIPGDQSIVPNDKKRKVAAMTSSIKDLKDDHRKKRRGVKFEASIITINTVKEQMNKEPIVAWCKAERRFYRSFKLNNEKKHKQVSIHYIIMFVWF